MPGDLLGLAGNGRYVNSAEASSRLACSAFRSSSSPRMGGLDAATRRLFLPMSRFDIAGYLGTSVESVTRAFAALEQSCSVRRSWPRIVEIRDFVGLERLMRRSFTARISRCNDGALGPLVRPGCLKFFCRCCKALSIVSGVLGDAASGPA